jgi:hypothetical protein
MGESPIPHSGNSTIYSVQPPDNMLREAKHAVNFFKFIGNIYPGVESQNSSGSAYRLLTEEEIEAVSLMVFMKLPISSILYLVPCLLPFYILQHRGSP